MTRAHPGDMSLTMAYELHRWEEYFQKVQGRTPRPLLLDVLARFAEQPVPSSRSAIDLGCGDGTESRVLLERGWSVLAIDGHPVAISRLMANVPPDHLERLQTQVAVYEDVLLHQTNLVLACFSLPFCHPEHFDELWNKVVDAILPGGRFAGHFFGVRDSWAGDPAMTFHTEDQIRALLHGFEFELFDEQDEDGLAASGPKHWHFFTIIARKR